MSATPRLRAPGVEDASFLFELAASCDLRWPAISRFGATMTPASVLTALQSSVEVGYLVLGEDREPVGVLGFVDADPPSRVMWLDGHGKPNDVSALGLIRAAVPVVLDEAERAGTVRFVYHDEYPELEESIIEETRDLWEAEVRIPRFVQIDGTWCTRITWRLELSRWSNR